MIPSFLPPGAAACLPAVVEDRIQEALRLARAGAGGDDGRAAHARGKPRERGALVAVRGEPERHLRERLAALRGAPEGKRDGEIRPLDEVLGVREEVRYDARKLRTRRPEAGGEEVTQGAGDFGRDDGGDHVGGGSCIIPTSLFARDDRLAAHARCRRTRSRRRSNVGKASRDRASQHGSPAADFPTSPLRTSSARKSVNGPMSWRTLASSRAAM